MKILIASDSFKESLSSLEVAEQIEKGFRNFFSNATYIKQPIADGGEGTVNAMVAATNGKIVNIKVVGPLGLEVPSFIGFSEDRKTAFIEMAAASGLELVPLGKRDPLITTSYGTGQLINYALANGIEKCVIGIGGSATNDGGAGMLQALGVKLLDKNGKEIGYGARSLKNLESIDMSTFNPLVYKCHFEVACDVTNPLLGINGASYIFGPQKGATEESITILDRNLGHYAEIVENFLSIDIKSMQGAGAAGGMGFALYAFLDAKLRPGFEIIASHLNLPSLIQEADLVITGEGKLDNQSINGKVPIGVATLAKKYNKPVIAIAGCLGDDLDAVYAHGIDASHSILHKVTDLNNALSMAKDNLYNCSRNIAATLKIGRRLKQGNH